MGQKELEGPLENIFLEKFERRDLRHKKESESSGIGVTGKNTYFLRTLMAMVTLVGIKAIT